MKRLLLFKLIVLCLISTSACSNASSADAAASANTVTPETTTEPSVATEPKSETTPEPSTEPVESISFTTEGTYSLFGVMNEGSLVKSSELEKESDIVLEEGGAGSMSLDNDRIDITKWELTNDTVSITLSDGGQANAKVHDGILDLDLHGDGSMILYYAQENADISGYKFLTLEEVKQKQSNKE